MRDFTIFVIGIIVGAGAVAATVRREELEREVTILKHNMANGSKSS